MGIRKATHSTDTPITSTIFEKLLCKQLTLFSDKHLSKFQCGFRKGYSAQHCLIGNVFGELLTDLSKEFDCLSHELITAKLNAYGFSFNSLKLMNNCLSHKKKDISSEEILFGVPEGSILGLTLFNIFLSDLFLIIKDTNFANYVDDNTIYKACNNVDDVILYLQQSPEKLFKWFPDNQMKGNTDQCHLIMSSDDSSAIIGKSLIKRSNYKKLLSVKIIPK